MAITDETLVAYADGQLDGNDAKAVERAIAADPALATRLAQMVGAADAVRKAHPAPAPVPAALEARVRALIAADLARRATAPVNVIDIESRRRVVPFWQVPLAAMLALGIGAGAVWLGAQRDDPGGLRVAALANPEVTRALNQLPSGQTADIGAGATVSIVSSFRDAADRLCREIEQRVADGTGVVAVVCREDAGWKVRLVVATGATDEGSYAPASSNETLDAYLSATEAGAPLSRTDEAQALQDLN